MHLFFRQSVKGRGNLLISQHQHFFESFSLCHFCGHGRGGYGGGATAFDPELHVGKNVVLDFDKNK
jgi:hypothetical protein